MLYLVAIYFYLFLHLAIKRFPLAIYLFLATLPAYLIRFDIGPLPSTLVEVSFFALALGWLSSVRKKDWQIFKHVIENNKLFFVFLLGILFFSFVGAFTSMIGAENPMQKLIYGIGEWRALFLEPILLLIILLTKKQELEDKKIIWSLALAAVFVSIIAIIQKFTGLLFPPSLWHAQLFGRVTSVFTTANAIGLFTVPILFLLFSTLPYKKVLLLVSAFIIFLANLFSVSQGAWIALGAGVLVYIFIRGYKKIAIGIAILGIIGSFAVPSMRAAILFEDQAGHNRLTIWSHTVSYLIESPKNFILGTGIRNFFDAIQKPFYDPTKLEALKYPHNIMLNFWTETGFFGMISIVGIVISLSICISKITDTSKKAALAAALIALVVHGLVDVPYFKNDLAMLFWVVVFILLNHTIREKHE